MKIVALSGLLLCLTSCSTMTGTGRAVMENVDFGVGVHTAPDGWTYGPGRVRPRKSMIAPSEEMQTLPLGEK